MNEAISPSVRRLASTFVDGERFTDSNDVLLFSLEVMASFEDFYAKNLVRELQRGFDEINDGRGECLKTKDDIHSYFARIKQKARAELSNQPL